MSRWTDQFEAHAIHETLRQVREWASVEIEDIDSKHEAEKRRLIKVLDSIKATLEGIDPEFFPDSELTHLSNDLRHQHFWNELNSYSTDGNSQHLVVANDHLNSQVPRVYQLAGMSTKPESRKAIKGIEAAYDKFCESIERTSNDFDNKVSQQSTQVSAIENKLPEISDELDKLRGEIEGQLSTWLTEFTEAQTSRSQDYSTTQIDRGKEFDEALREMKAGAELDRNETKMKHDTAFKKALDAFITNVESKNEDIKQKHQSILDIHELVVTDGVAGGYKKNADDEQRAANTWRWISMGWYSLVLLWVVFKGWLGFGIADSGSLDWPVIVTTISVTAVAVVAAQFASRQSRIHRINEQRMRWFSLEVKAIDPFISSLPEEMQQGLKRQLSERLFGQDRVADDKAGKSIDAASIKDMTDSIVNAVKALGKKT